MKDTAAKLTKSLSDFASRKKMKLDVARQINAHIRDCGMSQAQAATTYGIDAGIISHVCNANLDAFTLDRLLGIAEVMGVVGVINFETKKGPKTRPS